jgi:hypothetical protein
MIVGQAHLSRRSETKADRSPFLVGRRRARPTIFAKKSEQKTTKKTKKKSLDNLR